MEELVEEKVIEVKTLTAKVNKEYCSMIMDELTMATIANKEACKA